MLGNIGKRFEWPLVSKALYKYSPFREPGLLSRLLFSEADVDKIVDSMEGDMELLYILYVPGLIFILAHLPWILAKCVAKGNITC